MTGTVLSQSISIGSICKDEEFCERSVRDSLFDASDKTSLRTAEETGNTYRPNLIIIGKQKDLTALLHSVASPFNVDYLVVAL